MPRRMVVVASRFAIAVALLLATGCTSSAREARPSGKAPASYPAPERFEGDIQAFMAQDVISPPPLGAIVCVGSSSMRFWHETIAADLAPLTVVPRGFGGSTMLDVLHYADRIVMPCQPRAVLLYEGDNDIDFGVSPREVHATFVALVTKIHSRLPQTRIYVMSIKPSGARWHIWPQMQVANRLLESECDGDPRLIYIDVATTMLNEQGEPREEIFLPDRLHLNAAGYELWRAAVRPVLLDLELRFESEVESEARGEGPAGAAR